MKSKHLLLTLLMALLVPWAAQAQETLELHDGSAYTRGVPFYAFYCDEYTKSQHVIPAEELADMAGGTITKLKYYYSKSYSSSNPFTTVTESNVSVNLYIKEVESTTISSLASFSESDLAFSGKFYFQTDGTVEFVLTNEYTYEGGNLLIGIENPVAGGSGNYHNVYFFGESGTDGMSTYSNNSSSFSSITYKSNNTTSFLPHTIFTYEPAAQGDCEKPETVTPSQITPNTAMLNWEGGSTPGNGYNVEIKGGQYADWTSYASNISQGCQLTQLVENTAYQARVQVVCSTTETSIWKSTGFSTPAYFSNFNVEIVPGQGNKAVFSWTENGFTPSAWQLCINDDEENLITMTENPFTYDGLTPEVATTAKMRAFVGDNTGTWSNPVTFTPTDSYVVTLNEGTNTSSYIPFYYSTGSSYYSNIASQFIIPATALTNLQWGSIEKLTFYNSLASNSYGTTEFTVYLGETSNTTQTAFTDWATLTQVYTGTVSVSDNKMVIEFNQPFTYTNSNLLIGFKKNTTGTSGSSCSWQGVTSTTGVSVYSISNTSAAQSNFLPQVTINYTPGEAPSCLPPTGLAVTADGLDATFTWESDATKWQVAHATSATDDPDENIMDLVSTTTFPMNDLPLADHYFWVRTYCSETEQSMWAGPASVHIGYCTPSITNVDGNGFTNVTFGIAPTQVNNDVPKTTYADFTTLVGAVQAGVEATIAITNSTGYDYGTIIWVDLNKNLSFEDNEIMFTYNLPNSSTPYEATITIPATQAVGDYVMRIGGADSAFDNYISGSSSTIPSACFSTNWGTCQDYTLRVLEAPSCMIPTGLALSRNNNQITASWEGTADTYNIDINGTVTEGITNPYVFTAELSTTYTVMVQANCTGGETSGWSKTKSITTPDCWNGRVIEYTLTDSYSDGWESANITVIEGCGNVVATLTVSVSSNSGTLELCGDYYQFVHNLGTCCQGEHSWTFTEGGETIFSGNGNSYADGEVLYTIGTQLPMPTGLDATPDTYSLELSWTENGDAEAWQICVNGDEENLIDITISDVTIDQNEVTYPLNGLTENTPYLVKVRSYTTEMQSCWTDEETFTTLALCPVPVMGNATNIGHYTATVSWTDAGNNAPYTVSYCTAGHYDVDFTEDFADETVTNYDASTNYLPEGWKGYNSDPGYLPRVSNAQTYGYMSSAFGSTNNYLLLTYNKNNQYVFAIMPQYSNIQSLQFNYAYESASTTYTYGILSVGYVTDNSSYNTYVPLQTLTVTDKNLHSFTMSATDIATINAANGYVTFRYEGTGTTFYSVGIDDIVLTAGNYNEGGAWTEVPATDIDGTTASLSGLEMGTKYDVKVAVSCGSESETVSFTTVSENEKYFLGTESSEWLEAGNWEPAGAPTFDQTVELRADVTITGEALAKTINTSTYLITIEDGAKLKSNSSVYATVKKNIVGYENYTGEDNGGYYLIANPITSSSVTPSEENGFLTGNFDLYNWNYDDLYNNDNEWLNYRASSFYLNTGAYGYLYANETGTTLTYTGNINAYTGSKSRSCSVASYPESYDFPSWYLLGNPYMYDAYLANASTNGTGLAYYRMNEAGDRIEPATAGTPIAPMEGFFYQGTTDANYAYVVTYKPAVVSESELAMTVSKGRSTEDNAIIVFGGNQSLGKMSFRKGSTKLYIPVDNKDYAIVSTESSVGEMPVSFKAESNGSYTLSFSSQEVSFSYLHLIDNMTGNDVDLLKTPSYTFDARTTDYASRFRLVFATGSSVDGDTFGFVNAMGNLCIFGIEGEATLQVVDVLGHVVSSNQFSGSYESKLNVAPGVYMLRLINGNDVKVQKMIVK